MNRLILVALCFVQLSTVAAPTECPENILIATLSPAAKALAKTTSFTFNNAPYEQGKVVDISYDGPTNIAPKRTTFHRSLPNSTTGIVVGTFIDNTGGTRILLDCGKGLIRRIPLSRIQQVGASTKTIAPSRLTNAERAFRKLRSLYRASTQLLFSTTDFVISKVGPPTAGLVSLGYVGYHGYQLAKELASTLDTTTTAIGLTALGIGALTENGQQVVGAAVKIPFGVGKLGANIAIGTAKLPFRFPSILKKFRRLLGIWRLYDAIEAHQKNPEEDLGPARFIEKKKQVSLYICPRAHNTDKDFPKTAKALFHQSIAVKEYLQRLGLPKLDKDISLWISEDGAAFLKDVGPFALPTAYFAYVGPVEITHRQRLWAHLKAWLLRKTKPTIVSNERLRSSVQDASVWGHELVHMLVQRTLLNLLGTDYAIDGILDEALADYLSVSALDLKSPVIVPALFEDGSPVREGITRSTLTDYPAHLNFNHLASVNGDTYGSSQVIFRFLWRLREQFGRETIDRLIIQTIPLFPQARKIDLTFGDAPGYARPANAIAQTHNRVDVVLFVTLLYQTAQRQEHSNTVLDAITQSANRIGVPEVVIQNGLLILKAQIKEWKPLPSAYRNN